MSLMDMSPMNTYENKLIELGYHLPKAPAPAAVYQPFMQTGNQLWTAGQIAVKDGQLLYNGIVGAEVTLEQARECAQQCALNLLAQVKAACGSLDAIVKVVKLNVFVASTPDFTSQHLVANGASELFGELFGSNGVHARSAVGVAVLPLNSPVEIDAIFEVKIEG
jgi:enamine deaminase RidA (YjgF/YER057c/UK114 family)